MQHSTAAQNKKYIDSLNIENIDWIRIEILCFVLPT